MIHPDATAMDTEARRLARGAAGLLTLLSIRATEICRQERLDRVLFLTREGIVFRRFHDILTQYCPELPTSVIFEVSRLSTFGPSLAREGISGLTRLYSQYQNANLDQTLKSLGVGPLPAELKEQLLFHPLTRLMGSAILDALHWHPDLMNWIQTQVQSQLEAINSYVESRHSAIVERGAALVVDIGWRGTIQDNLARIRPDILWHGLYLGLFSYLNPQVGNARKSALLFADGERFLPIKGSEVFPVEYLFHVDVGSIIGYRDGMPLSARASGSGGLEFVARFQQALMEEAHAIGKVLQQGTGSAQLEVLQRRAVAFWQDTQQMGPELYTGLKQFNHDETFGLGQVIQIKRLTSLPALLRSLIFKKDRQLFIQHSLSMPMHQRMNAPWWLRTWFGLHRLFHGLKGDIDQRKPHGD